MSQVVHLETTWGPLGDHYQTTSRPKVDHNQTTSSPLVYHQYPTSRPLKDHQQTTSRPQVDHLQTTSRPQLYHYYTITLAIENICDATCISDVVFLYNFIRLFLILMIQFPNVEFKYLLQIEQEGLKCKCSISCRRVRKLHVAPFSDILGEWIWYNSHQKLPFFDGYQMRGITSSEHPNLF